MTHDTEWSSHLLRVAERRQHILDARKHVVFMAAMLVLLSLALLWQLEPREMAYTLAIASFGLGYGLRAVLEHVRRSVR